MLQCSPSRWGSILLETMKMSLLVAWGWWVNGVGSRGRYPTSFHYISVVRKCLLSLIPIFCGRFRNRHSVDNPKNCPLLSSKSFSASFNLEGFNRASDAWWQTYHVICNQVTNGPLCLLLLSGSKMWPGHAFSSSCRQVTQQCKSLCM